MLAGEEVSASPGQPFLRFRCRSTHRSLVASILTQKEIKRLYDVTGEDILGQRDPAMLAVYYGCGLRKVEGVHLQATLTRRSLS